MTQIAIKCSWCQTVIDDPDEAANPYLDEWDQPMCGQCYHDHYEFTCCLCQEFEHVDHQHRYLVVAEAVDDVRRGVYRIVRKPYYVDGMLDGFLLAGSLKRVARVPKDVDTRDYPCGHLCRECAEKLRLESKP